MSQQQPPLATWIESNSITTLPADDRIFKYDSAEQEEIRSAKPWDRDPNYFKTCKISASALLKMAIHAKSGGNIEVCKKNVACREYFLVKISIFGQTFDFWSKFRFLVRTSIF